MDVAAHLRASPSLTAACTCIRLLVCAHFRSNLPDCVLPLDCGGSVEAAAECERLNRDLRSGGCRDGYVASPGSADSDRTLCVAVAPTRSPGGADAGGGGGALSGAFSRGEKLKLASQWPVCVVLLLGYLATQQH